MGKTDLKLFKQAISEGLSRRIERELAMCEGEIICSDRHLQTMRRIINKEYIFSPYQDLGKTKVAAALVAATLLLASCAAGYKEEIRDFIKTVYEDHFSIGFPSDADDPDVIVTVYILTYVPEGYTLRDEVLDKAYSYYFYENENGVMLTFIQMPLNTSFGFGEDLDEGEIIYVGEHQVFCRKNDLSTSYIWNDGKYAMMIESDFPIDGPELARIIDGVEKAK